MNPHKFCVNRRCPLQRRSAFSTISDFVRELTHESRNRSSHGGTKSIPAMETGPFRYSPPSLPIPFMIVLLMWRLNASVEPMHSSTFSTIHLYAASRFFASCSFSLRRRSRLSESTLAVSPFVEGFPPAYWNERSLQAFDPAHEPVFAIESAVLFRATRSISFRVPKSFLDCVPQCKLGVLRGGYFFRKAGKLDQVTIGISKIKSDDTSFLL